MKGCFWGIFKVSPSPAAGFEPATSEKAAGTKLLTCRRLGIAFCYVAVGAAPDQNSISYTTAPDHAPATALTGAFNPSQALFDSTSLSGFEVQDNQRIDDVPTLNHLWLPQGPGPILNGQVANVEPNNEVAGAIHAALAHPTDPGVLYIGALNGGIWKTTNATIASPDWQPLTDHLSSLSIGAMAFDPSDAQTILAGIDRTSGFSEEGGPLDGLLLTRDAGETWTQIDLPPISPRVTGVSVHGNQLVVATRYDGLLRSEDGGRTWTRILEDGWMLDLVEDPGDTNRLYVSRRGIGILRSEDGGETWQNITGHDEAISRVFRDRVDNAEMAIAPNGRLYVGVVVSGQVQHIGFTDDRGDRWTAMDLPRIWSHGTVTGIHPGRLGRFHFAIAVDPKDANVVYVGGDWQDPPNLIGAKDFTGNLFRGDTTVLPTGYTPSPQWEHLTHSNAVDTIPGGGTASGSAPHAGAREIVFDANGDLIEVDDGGIYRRTSSRDNTGDWYSLNGNLQIAEIHSIAYDAVSDIIIGGTQGTGTTFQTSPGSRVWDTLSGGSGGDVAVDTSGWPERSIRYSSDSRLRGFRRTTYSSNNAQSRVDIPTLLVNGERLQRNFSFVQRFELNAVEQNRGVLGAGSLYETFDRFDTLEEVLVGGVTRTAYGCADNADFLYVSRFQSIVVRTDMGSDGEPTADDFVTTAYGGGAPADIAIDPDDCDAVYVIDRPYGSEALRGGGVYVSDDRGQTWRNVTGNLWDGTGLDWPDQELHKIKFIPSGESFDDSAAIAVAGQAGVRVMALDDEGSWFNAGIGLPNAPVRDLDYDDRDRVLVAGTLGRGAWRLRAGPVARASIGDRVLEVGQSVTVDLSDSFHDGGNTGLAYTAESSDPTLASVTVEDDVLTVVQKAAGAVTITVTATDRTARSDLQTFTVSAGALVTVGSASAREGDTAMVNARLSRALDSTVTISYRIGNDDEWTTADADSEDHSGGSRGTVSLAAGDTSAAIEIAITDDDIIEPTREVFTLTLEPPTANPDFGLGIERSATITIHEGVCDRTGQVRDAIRMNRDCAEVVSLRDIRTLDLTAKGIAGLRAGDFDGLLDLAILHLDRNGLARLPQGIFDDLRTLSWLGLSRNALEAIPAGLFDGSTSLRNLFLDGNRLDDLPNGIFLGLHELDTLRLSDNPLQSMAASLFDGLTKLRVLQMQGNGLTDLPEGIFDGLHNLNDLWMSGNELESIPADLLEGLTNLRSLSLHSNRLSTLVAGNFVHLPNLEYLSLRNNALSYLPSGVFRGLSSLERLILRSNPLEELSPGAFEGLSSLRRLFLNNNQLTNLPAGIFNGMTMLESVRLENNPGAPFMLVVELQRSDTTELFSDSPATVSALAPQGAPFPMTANLAITGGNLSANRLTVPKGHTTSSAATVTQQDDHPVSVRVNAVSDVPTEDCRTGTIPVPCYTGIETAPGPPLHLFKSRPAILQPISSQTLDGDGDALTIDLSRFLSYRTGTRLRFTATVDDPLLVTVSVEGNILTITSNEDAEGDVTVTVTATNVDGFSETLSFVVTVGLPVPGELRGWRLILIEKALQNDVPDKSSGQVSPVAPIDAEP